MEIFKLLEADQNIQSLGKTWSFLHLENWYSSLFQAFVQFPSKSRLTHVFNKDCKDWFKMSKFPLELVKCMLKLFHGIYETGLTWKDQNLGRKVEVMIICIVL